MKILEGLVISNVDPDRQGMLAVAVDNQRTLLYVFYTSPYGGNSTHGMYAIPEIGDQVLVTQPDDSNLWFYLTSVYKSQPGSENTTSNLVPAPGDQLAGNLLPDHLVYKSLGVPQRYGIKSPLGNQLVLSDSSNELGQNIYAKVQSAKGKKIVLNDSENIDSIIIRNEHGDHIKISTKSIPIKGQAGRMIEVDCKGPLRLISREGSIDMRVVDGREINIENTSTGSKKNPGAPDAFGNINLISQYKDININVKNSQGKVNVASKGNIEVKAEGTLDIDVKKEVTINSDIKLTVTAPQIYLN